MKFLVKITLLLLLPFALQAQGQKKQLDTLYLKLKHAPNDTVRMDVCASLGVDYAESNRDSSLWFRDKALSFARKLNLKVDEADILVGQGYAFVLVGNYSRSLQSFLQALKILEDPANDNNPFHLTDAQTTQCTRLSTLGGAYFAEGLLYYAVDDTAKALADFTKARNVAATARDTMTAGYSGFYFGLIYLNMGKLEAALASEQGALPIIENAKRTGDRRYTASALVVLGNIYQKQGKLALARQAFLKAGQIGKQLDNFASAGEAYVTIAESYQTSKKIDSAIYYARQGVATLNGIGEPAEMAAAYNLLSSLFLQQSKNDSAFAYLRRAAVLNDSLAAVRKKNLSEFQKVGFSEQLRLDELEKEKIQVRNTIWTVGLLASIAVFVLIAGILYRNNKQKQKTNKTLEETLADLRSTQGQLIQREKMASLGELTAGIAHEIQNPLNFVNNFSDVSAELIDEMQTELKAGDRDEAIAISEDIKQNLEKIRHHGKRADFIVKGMLQHSRKSSGEKQPTNMNVLCEEFLKLSFHGMEAKDKSFNAEMVTHFDPNLPSINVSQQDMGRVMLNLFNNAFYAVNQKAKTAGPDYKPAVEVSVGVADGQIVIAVKDNGNGIPGAIKDKIMQPFFTTKPTGEGTGLGLSLSYDIVVKGHGGKIDFTSNENTGSEFIISLPPGK